MALSDNLQFKVPPIHPLRQQLNRSRDQSKTPRQHMKKQSSLTGLVACEQQQYSHRHLLHFKRLFNEQQEKIKALSIQLLAKDARLSRIERILKCSVDRKASELFEARNPTHGSQYYINKPKQTRRRTLRYPSGYNISKRQCFETEYEQNEEQRPEESKIKGYSQMNRISDLQKNRDSEKCQQKIRVPLQRLRRIPKAEILKRVKEASNSYRG